MSLPVTLLLLAGLLVMVSLVQRVAARFALPAPILFAIIGVVLGGTATAVIHGGFSGRLGEFAHVFADVPVNSGTFLYILLPALLFQSALTVDVRHIVEDAAPIFLLAVIAVLVATAVIGFSLAPIAGVGTIAALLLASIVATTDTVAVISIFRDVGAPSRLCRLVEGESLLNDAAAIVTFTVLLKILGGVEHTTAAGAVLEFVYTFAGGVGVGYVGARLVTAVLPWLQDFRLAQATLTLALPYVVFIVGDRGLEVSGVIAAVTAGLAMSALAQPRIPPSDWKFLLDLWDQLAYWCSSLIFVLAALIVPRLLTDVSWHDALVLGAMIVAAIGARALVLFGFFPALTRLGLTERLSAKYNVVILWGALRGAVTLALALAVNENTALPEAVRRFVAVNATGFVLFTLLVPGLTLRPLITWLGLDQLSPFDTALRRQVLALSRSRVAEVVRRIGAEYQFGDELAASVAGSYQAPSIEAQSALPASNDEQQLRLALVSLTHRERELILEHFDARTVSGPTVELLLGHVRQLLDRARTRSDQEYLQTAERLTGFSRGFRLALMLHRVFGVDGPLVDKLADRFEQLLVTGIVLDELQPYITETIVPLVKPTAFERLTTLLDGRRAMTHAALEALEAQYADYAALLRRRFLERLAHRREDLEYRVLFDEHVIGPELYGALQRDLAARRAAAHARPKLDLGLETRALIARVPLFSSLDADQLSRVARLLKPRFAVPGERLISTGDVGDAMYFISAGVVEVLAGTRRVLLTRGDFFGEMALVFDQPRQADVNALAYCQMLVLARRDFQSLVRSSKSIRAQIDRAASDRSRMNAPEPTSDPER